MKKICCTLFAVLTLTALAPTGRAQEPPAPGIRIADYASFSVARVLEENVGKQVEVTVASGATFRGKLVGVGAQAIHLAELSGKEFYDAAIAKDAIVAVVLRVRDR